MPRTLSLLALLAGCAGPTAPDPATAEVVGGFWFVSLDGSGVTSCIGLPYHVPDRDTAREAIRDCRRAAP